MEALELCTEKEITWLPLFCYRNENKSRFPHRFFSIPFICRCRVLVIPALRGHQGFWNTILVYQWQTLVVSLRHVSCDTRLSFRGWVWCDGGTCKQVSLLLCCDENRNLHLMVTLSTMESRLGHANKMLFLWDYIEKYHQWLSIKFPLITHRT